MNWRPGTSYQSKQFRVGSMRERIDIQTSTDAVDSAGQPIRTWTDLYQDEPAAFVQTTGGETLRGRQITAGIAAVFTIHRRESITPQLQIIHGSDTYGIVHVIPVEGGRRYLELDCKRVS